MSRSFLSILLFTMAQAFFYYNGQAQVVQQVIGAGGGTSKALAGYTVDFTIGETAILTAGTNPACTEGLHQPLTAADYTHVGLRLSAVNQGSLIHLAWQTLTEVNNAYFIVERSGDGILFADIASVPSSAAGGNSSSPLFYTHNDGQPLNGANYYRIRELSRDGTIRYSETVLVNFTLPAWFVQVYPNPVHDRLTIHAYMDRPGNIDFRLIDMLGRVIKVSRLSFAQGFSDAGLYMGSLQRGVYILYIGDEVHNAHREVKLLKE